MFERFTAGAKAAIEAAQQECGALGQDHVGTEHLLLGLLSVGGGLAARALEDAGVRAEDVRADVARRVVARRLTDADAEALRTIGIEVDQIRARVEASFGPGALARGRPRGRIPFSPRRKTVLELSLREALRLHHDYIGTEHVLLAILREGQGLAARVLADSGVRADDLRTAVLAALGRVA